MWSKQGDPDREVQELELQADLVLGGGCRVLVAALAHLPGDGEWCDGRLRGGGCPGGSGGGLGAVPGAERRWQRLDLGGWLGWAIEHW